MIISVKLKLLQKAIDFMHQKELSTLPNQTYAIPGYGRSDHKELYLSTPKLLKKIIKSDSYQNVIFVI